MSKDPADDERSLHPSGIALAIQGDRKGKSTLLGVRKENKP